MAYAYTRQRQVRQSFWDNHPRCSRKLLGNGDYTADTRMAFCDWVDYLARSGAIPESLASRVTLK